MHGIARMNGSSRAPFAFKDSVIEWFCNWYQLSHFAAFFNEIRSQVIHRDTLWGPCYTKLNSRRIQNLAAARRLKPKGFNPRISFLVRRILIPKDLSSLEGFVVCHFSVNDPAAGSPTATLLRLLLPLLKKYRWTLGQVRHPSIRSPVLHHHRKQRRAVCTNGRDVIGTVWWAAPTRYSSLRDQ